MLQMMNSSSCWLERSCCTLLKMTQWVVEIRMCLEVLKFVHMSLSVCFTLPFFPFTFRIHSFIHSIIYFFICLNTFLLWLMLESFLLPFVHCSFFHSSFLSFQSFLIPHWYICSFLSLSPSLPSCFPLRLPHLVLIMLVFCCIFWTIFLKLNNFVHLSKACQKLFQSEELKPCLMEFVFCEDPLLLNVVAKIVLGMIEFHDNK